jgi:hypothetical protein
MYNVLEDAKIKSAIVEISAALCDRKTNNNAILQEVSLNNTGGISIYYANVGRFDTETYSKIDMKFPGFCFMFYPYSNIVGTANFLITLTSNNVKNIIENSSDSIQNTKQKPHRKKKCTYKDVFSWIGIILSIILCLAMFLAFCQVIVQLTEPQSHQSDKPSNQNSIYFVLKAFPKLIIHYFLNIVLFPISIVNFFVGKPEIKIDI